MQLERVEREMTLILACCRWPVSPDRLAMIRTAGTGVDWPRVLALARRHRVQGHVHHALAKAGVAPPAPVAEAIQKDAHAIAARNLRLAAETVRLVRRLEGQDVPVMAIKGTALAALAYGTLAIKMSWDVDILVTPEGVGRAADVLGEAGYACVLPGPDRGDLAPWHRYSKESVWQRGDVHVELHSALVDSARVLPGLDASAPVLRVEVSPGLTLPTLERDALFSYLCVHGAASGWRRAKWIADVVALIGDADEREIERLYTVSQALGAGRAAGQALLLADGYLGLSLPPVLKTRLGGMLGVRAMARVAGRMMTAPEGFDDPRETALGTFPIHAMQMMIMPGWRFLWSELGRKSAPDPRLGVVRRRERWLYPIVALARRISRRSRPAG